MRKKNPPSAPSASGAHQPVEFATVGEALRALSQPDAERYISARTRYAYVGDNRGLAVVLGGYKMHVDTSDRGFTPHMILDGFWEYWLTKFLADNVHPGDVVCDVGANMGYYSLLLGELVGGQGHVHCFEPNAHMCELLRGTLVMNSLGRRATIHEVALVEANGPDVHFFIPRNEPKNACIVAPGYSRPDGSTVSVRARSLDSFDFNRLDLLKIDVEGAEIGVLRGLRRLKDRFQPKIVCEINFARGGYAYDDIVELLGSNGQLLHIDYSGYPAVLTREMSLRERVREDWLVYYPGK